MSAYRKTLLADRRMIAARYDYAHAAHKVVGVGSVGSRAWIILLLGRDADDPLFLQAKEAQRSVLEPYAAKSPVRAPGPPGGRGPTSDAGRRRHLPRVGPGEGTDGSERDFYVRQLWDGKRSVEVEAMDAGGLRALRPRLRVDARAGACQLRDRVAIAAYLGSSTGFDEAVADFAEAYADQNERDYAELSAEAKAGRLAVRTGL